MTETTGERNDPLQMTVRGDEDLIALAPVLLGFWPEDDIVMLTFGGSRAFHARLDLPARSEQTSEALARITASLLVPALRHDVRAVVFLCHAEHPDQARAVARALCAACDAAGIVVLRALALDGTLAHDLTAPRSRPIPYDVADHPFVVEAIVRGRIGYASRAAMVRALEADPAAIATVEALAEDLAAELAAEELAERGRSDAVGARRLPHELPGRIRAGQAPTQAEVAHLVARLSAGTSASDLITAAGDVRPTMERWFWASVLPRTPREHVPEVATALARAAWRSGDGAMAWVAVDRALGVDATHAPALEVADLLERAVPPEAG